MAESMVRKQIYLYRRQNMLLKRLAKQRGVSEAEVVRQALEHETSSTIPIRNGEINNWEEIRHFVDNRKATLTNKGRAVVWNRQELYEERENR
jgi:hypothetical protein